MHKIIQHGLAAAIMLMLSYASTAQSSDDETIKMLNKNFLDAIVNRDSAALGKVLANDFLMVNAAGIKRTKADNLNNAVQPGVKILSDHIDSVQVRMITNDVGILSAWTTFEIEAGGKKTIGKNCYQDIYAKRNGVWLAVSAHVTMLGTRDE